MGWITIAIKNTLLSADQLRHFFDEQGMGTAEIDQTIALIQQINELKKQKNAVILAHYYMRDAIKFGIADYIGDSLDLSKAAVETTADIIVFCGVLFMAETAKIVNPQKKVLLPDLEAGCSLAESINVEDVKALRKQYPHAAFVTYVNTLADIKAECDVCVTSANAPKVVARLPEKQIVFMPDKYMGKNLQNELPEKEIIIWDGACVVHEVFAPLHFAEYRTQYPGIKILAHYECDESVLAQADMHGATSDMRKYVREHPAPAYFIATECGLASTIKAEFPESTIIGPCNVCPYMKKNSLQNTLKALQEEKPEIIIPEAIRQRAERSLQRMFSLTV
ncbi:quinolinate synthase NadA [Candidatus Woesearchaeota archaeon]|nr:quinolinate synthase NadA [Candidatus Woesearchaeota archaeon]